MKEHSAKTSSSTGQNGEEPTKGSCNVDYFVKSDTLDDVLA